MGDAYAGDGLGNAVFKDEEVIGFEAGHELVGLVEDYVGVNVDNGDVDTERVGIAVWILDLRLGWRSGRRGLVAFLLLFEDDGAVVCGWASVVRSGLSRGFLLRRGRGLRLDGWQRKQEEGGSEKEDAGRKRGMGGRHRLKLYSDCWTSLKSLGEN